MGSLGTLVGHCVTSSTRLCSHMKPLSSFLLSLSETQYAVLFTTGLGLRTQPRPWKEVVVLKPQRTCQTGRCAVKRLCLDEQLAAIWECRCNTIGVSQHRSQQSLALAAGGVKTALPTPSPEGL